MDIVWCSWLDHWGRGRESINDEAEHPRGTCATYLHIGKIVWETGVKCGGGRQAERGVSVLDGKGWIWKVWVTWRGWGASRWE